MTTNDNTIKLWKVNKSYRDEFRPSNKTCKNEKDLQIPKKKRADTQTFAHQLKGVYPQLHQHPISFLSVCSNGENFLSGDALKVNLWTLENKSSAFTVAHLKFDESDESPEVISSVKCHPKQDSLFIYSSTKGITRQCDMRMASTCDDSAIHFEYMIPKEKVNLFSEVLKSVSESSYSPDGNYILARDFLTVKVWDVRAPNAPVKTCNIFDPLKYKLSDLYMNEQILEKFGVVSSHDGSSFATGTFNGCFHIYDYKSDFNVQMEVNYSRKTVGRVIPANYMEKINDDEFNFERMILRSAWSPTSNTVAAICDSSIFIYSKQ